jgi:hypothetical protein
VPHCFVILSNSTREKFKSGDESITPDLMTTFVAKLTQHCLTRSSLTESVGGASERIATRTTRASR